MATRDPVRIRSYRAVVDDVERRIYRIDRWRLPLPGGIEVRAILYTLGAFICLAAAGGLPPVGTFLGALPAGIRWLALPILLGWALAAWRVDGRAPHQALIAAVRFALSSKSLTGLRRTAAVGNKLAPLAGVQVAPSGDEPAYRPGRVRGPATVTLRYPARLELGAGGEQPDRGRIQARRVVASAAGERVRPLARGHELRIPRGSQVRFR